MIQTFVFEINHKQSTFREHKNAQALNAKFKSTRMANDTETTIGYKTTKVAWKTAYVRTLTWNKEPRTNRSEWERDCGTNEHLPKRNQHWLAQQKVVGCVRAWFEHWLYSLPFKTTTTVWRREPSTRFFNFSNFFFYDFEAKRLAIIINFGVA